MTAADWGLVLFSVEMAALATLLLAPPALALAWALARGRWRGKPLVETLCSLPLVLPPTAVGLLLLVVLGAGSPLGRWLERAGVPVAFTWRAVVAAAAVMSLPLLLRMARAAFEGVDPRWERLARSLGRGPVHAFFTVTLPLAAPGIAAGLTLAFARALGEFGATILVAGNIPGRTQTLSLAIFHRIQTGHEESALRLVAVTTVVAFVLMWLSGALQRVRREGP